MHSYAKRMMLLSVNEFLIGVLVVVIASSSLLVAIAKKHPWYGCGDLVHRTFIIYNIITHPLTKEENRIGVHFQFGVTFK